MERREPALQICRLSRNADKCFRNTNRRWSKETISKLVKLEREIFLSGYYKTLLLAFDACMICDTCTGSRAECRNPIIARPGADAMGVDVYATVRSIGYP